MFTELKKIGLKRNELALISTCLIFIVFWVETIMWHVLTSLLSSLVRKFWNLRKN